MPVLASLQQLQPFSSTVLRALAVSPINVEHQPFNLLPIVAFGGLLSVIAAPSRVDGERTNRECVSVRDGLWGGWWLRIAEYLVVSLCDYSEGGE